MAKKPKIETTELQEDDVNSPAGQTIKTHPASKTGMIAQTLAAMMQMKPEECANWMAQALAMIGHENDNSDPSASAKNQASVAMRGAIKEDVLNIFGSEELSEEFKLKVETLFEAAVESRVAIELEALQEEAEAVVETNVQESINELVDKTDQYLTLVAKKWLSENQVAIDASLKTEITEEFMSGLKNLFMESYIDIPESKVDVVESLSAELDSLEVKYNESLKTNVQILEQINDLKKKEIFNQVAEGLTVSQVEKLKKLSESIDCDMETYASKLSILKENVSVKSEGKKPTPFMINEENDYSKEEVYIHPGMESYVKAISRTAKK